MIPNVSPARRVAVSSWWPCVALVAACAEPAPTPAPPNTTAASSATAWVRARPASSSALLEAPASVVRERGSESVVGVAATARVVEVRARVGQKVRAGDVLVKVQVPSLVVAAGEWLAAGPVVEALERQRTHLAELAADGLGRRAELLQAEAELARVTADRERARASLKAAGVSVSEARSIVDGGGALSLKSAIAGVVVSVDVTPGELRDPSDGALVRVAGRGERRVEARLVRPLPEGTTPVFELSDGRRLALTPVSDSPLADPVDGAVTAWFSLPAGAGLPAGLPGRLVALVDDASVVSVPSTAVVRGEASSVAVRRGEGAALVGVTVLASAGGEALVRGLSAGALVAGDEVAVLPQAVSGHVGRGATP